MNSCNAFICSLHLTLLESSEAQVHEQLVERDRYLRRWRDRKYRKYGKYGAKENGADVTFHGAAPP